VECFDVTLSGTATNTVRHSEVPPVHLTASEPTGLRLALALR
jgi:hypothetical protein